MIILLAFLFHIISVSTAQYTTPIYPPTSMVLTQTVNTASVTCQQTCLALGLRCMHDTMPLKTLNQYFVREWFWIVGSGKVCNKTGGAWDTAARSTAYYPATYIYRIIGDVPICYGWTQPTTVADASTCQATTKPLYYRQLCYCADTGRQAQMFGTDWTQLTTSYVKAMQFSNSSLVLWDNAQSLCQANNSAILPSISSQQENDELLQFARSKFGSQGLIWLNFYGDRWYDTGDRSPIYQNWQQGSQPTPTQYWVAAMNLVNGKWQYLYSLGANNTAFVVCRLLDFYRWTSNGVPEPPQFVQTSNTKISNGQDGVYLAENVTAAAYDCMKLCARNIQCMSATFQTSSSKCRQFYIYTPAHASTNVTQTDNDYTLFNRVISKNLF